MINRILISLISLLAVFNLPAQQSVGQWKVFPVVGVSYEKIIDSENKVYFLSSSSLYSYDKKTAEIYFYNASNKLSSSNITDIYYNHDDNYLIIVYADSNIDMLYDNGSCYALPEIKDANLTDDKTINDVAFGGGRIVVATNFGIVVYDAKKREVVESGIYRAPVDAVAVCDGHILLCTGYSILTSGLYERHNSLDKFIKLGGAATDDIMVLSKERYVWKNLGDKTLKITLVNFERNSIANTTTQVKVDSKLMPYKDGLYFRSGNKILLYNDKGEQVASCDIPADLIDCTFALWDGLSSVWFGGAQGSVNYDLSGSEPVVLSDWYRPESITCKEVVYFTVSDDGNRIYLTNLGPTESRKFITVGDGINIRQQTNLIENGRISDVSIINASADTGGAQSAQKSTKTTAMFGGTARMVEDPSNPYTYYIANGQEGVYVVKGREEIHKFSLDNTPFFTYWNTRTYDVNFDPQGNLWVGHDHMQMDYSPYMMLPASKLKKGFDKISKDDWQFIKIDGMNPRTKDFISFFPKKSNYGFFINGKGYAGVYVIDTKGTYDNTADDANYCFNTLYDQDGNSFQPQYYFALTEDHNGRVWVGTTQGLFYFNATAGINAYSSVVRPKVPRNDGTNYADFLLDSDQINSIAVDPSNRKWIATDFSGVFLVSENGDKILKHFDTTNSPLPSNRVISVVCDPHGNDVYFGTTMGMLSYKGDSSPAQDDFSEVYAYPNPVKPDYTGWITIAGLMDNSLVKIADAAGNVFFQGRSEGGMITWDGCNSAGQRVRSGIYFVYASTGGEMQQSDGVVTKIMVIN